MKIFKTSLRKINTAPLITIAFETAFLTHRKGYTIQLPKNTIHTQEMFQLVNDILEHQREIGIKFFIQGFLSSNWEIAQNLYLKKNDYNDSLTDWSTRVIRAIWKFSVSIWKARCDFVHGKESGKTTSTLRKELITLIKIELERTKAHAEHSTKQLRKNVQKSIGNAQIAALEIWLSMLRNVKGEIFQRKTYEGIRQTRAQPITKFFRRLTST